MEPHSDVLVVGGGIIGLTSAYFLAKAGLKVTVIDRQEFGKEASWAGAGILPPGNPIRAAQPIDKLRAEGVTRFAEFSAELRELTGIDNGYVKCGGVEFLDAEDADCVAMWEAEGVRYTPHPPPSLRSVDDLPHKGGGVISTSPLVGEVGECEARTGWGVLQPPHTTAYHLPDFAQVRNPWHLRALIAACQRVGVRFLTGEVNELYMVGDCKEAGCAITSDIRYIDAKHFIVTTGAWAARLLPSLPVRPVRGQIVLFRCERLPFTQILMHGKRYLVPRPDGRVLVGSTEEPEAGFEKANTPEGVEGLKQFAFEMCPALREAEVEKTWAGLRPGSPDGFPYIGPVPGVANVFAAVGHGRAGVQLSIGTALMVRELFAGIPSGLPLTAFQLDRPTDKTSRPAFRS